MLKDLSVQELSLTMASLANAAYTDDCSIHFSALGLNTYQFMSNQGAHGHLAAGDTEIIITFRGTNPSHITDLLADANALPVHDDNGFVHDGFKTYALHLMQTVLNFVWANGGKTKDIYITGHSLGAAMALYCARELQDNGYTVKQLISFGQPRLANKAYVDSIKAPHLRFVNCNDIITTVPPVEIGYRHHGQLCYINFYGNIRPVTWWQRFKDKWRNHYHSWLKGKFFDSLEDHMMGGYIAKLQNVLSTNQSID
jgi:triacylglycerol lipase